jgi:hypothetical protein
LLPLRPLGRTNIPVSPIGFGGAVIGIPDYLDGDDRDSAQFQEQADTTVRAAFEAGITYFDTAPGYGAGRSESVLGRVLEPYRDRVVYATKVQVDPADEPQKWWDSLHASLDRLRTDHVEVLQLHGSSWPDEKARWAIDGPGEWLAEVKSRGLANFVGTTAEVPSGGLELMLRSGRFDVLQMAYNVIYQAACDFQRKPPFGPIPLAKSLGMGVTTMRTTTSGMLHRLILRDFPELDPVRLSRLAIRYVLSTPQVDCALIGMSRPAEVAANVALAADEHDRIDVARMHDPYDPDWDAART